MRSLILAGSLLMFPCLLQDPEPAAPAAPQVGQAAPSFRLNDHTGKLVAVGGATDSWTVLAFYPKAATPG